MPAVPLKCAELVQTLQVGLISSLGSGFFGMSRAFGHGIMVTIEQMGGLLGRLVLPYWSGMRCNSGCHWTLKRCIMSAIHAFIQV